MQAAEDLGDEPTTVRETSAVWHVGALTPIEAAGATHAGRLRARNEDAFGIEEDLGLTMVADGLGGHPAGDIASQMAVQEVAEYMRDLDTEPTLPDVGQPAPPRFTVAALGQAVRHANRAIHFAGRNIPACGGMGTTFAGLLIVRGFAFFAHVGDSRIYRARAGELVRLTDDHSMAAEYLRVHGAGADPMILKQHESTLTRCLGAWPDVQVTLQGEPCAPGDVYLLCSDGLWGTLEHEALERLVVGATDLAEAAERLVEEANAAGGPDNITALLVRPLGGSTPPVSGDEEREEVDAG